MRSTKGLILRILDGIESGVPYNEGVNQTLKEPLIQLFFLLSNIDGNQEIQI